MKLSKKKRYALIASTNASVIRTVYARTCREQFKLDLVIVDRSCGAELFAEEQSVTCVRLPDGLSSEERSDAICEQLLKAQIDFAYIFFTRLLKGRLLDTYSRRLINFHPSLLPACAGLHGFEDSIQSGALVIGSTVHFVNEGMDTGPQIMQAACPVDRTGFDLTVQRHTIFAQQVACLLQVHTWLDSDRIALANEADHVTISEARHTFLNGFVPNLDPLANSIYDAVIALPLA